MLTRIFALLARWGLPEPLNRIAGWFAAALLLAGLLWGLKGCYDRRVIADHEQAVTQAVATASASACAEASDAVTQTRSEVEQTNDQARDAANRGGDPLGDGLRSLRAAKGAPRSASR